MKSSFSSLLGTLPRGAHTLQQIKTAGVSVRKEDRAKLNTSNQLKLSQLARAGGMDKFSFGKVGSDLKAV